MLIGEYIRCGRGHQGSHDAVFAGEGGPIGLSTLSPSRLAYQKVIVLAEWYETMRGVSMFPTASLS